MNLTSGDGGRGGGRLEGVEREDSADIDGAIAKCYEIY